MKTMLTLATKGYVADVSLLRNEPAGDLLRELLTFCQESEMNLWIPTQLVDVLKKRNPDVVVEFLQEYLLEGEIPFDEIREWHQTEKAAQFRNDLLEVGTSLAELGVEGLPDLDLTDQVLLSSKEKHLGIVAAGPSWRQRIRGKVDWVVRGAERLIWEPFRNWLVENGIENLKSLASGIIGKIVEMLLSIIPGSNLIADEAEYLMEKVFFHFDGESQAGQTNEAP